MKKCISVILVVLLLALSAFALAACVSGNDDWDNAFDAYKTADKVTVKINDDNLQLGNLVNRDHLVSRVEIAFDATQGLVYISMQIKHGTGFIDIDPSRAAYQWYYVIDGTTVTSYYTENAGEEWTAKKIMTFTTKDEAVEFLRDKYLHPVDINEEEFPSFLHLQYHGTGSSTSNPRETKANMFKTKFKQKFVEDRFEYNYELKFTLGGKLSKVTFRRKSSSGNIDDPRKMTMTVKYKANITLPSDLPKA